MSAASLIAFGVALAAHPQAAQTGSAAAFQPATASAAPIVPVRWVGGFRGAAFGRPWGWRGGCCWRGGWRGGWGPGWGWGWGFGAGLFGWGWPAPYPVAVPYAVPTPPPPPPAQAAPRSFMVYFDWDRADLTPTARQVISQAAAAAAQAPGTRLEVNGFTDLSGAAQYNATLSARRAAAVAAELARDGVDRDAIAVQSFGKTHPAVPTPDGVREPHNRDVEIDLVR